MKLHQLRYLAAVAQSGLNITAAAHKLHTSQPGVSKQIKLLEDELGFQVFVREGRNLTRITPAGQQVIERALKILQEAQSIRDLSTELRDEGKGSLSIGTTHTQARYVLPNVIRQFRERYPQVRLALGVGSGTHLAVDEDEPGLAGVDASHLFAAHTPWIGFRRGTLLRKYMYDFAQLLAPHLERRLIERAHRAASADEVARMFTAIELPLR